MSLGAGAPRSGDATRANGAQFPWHGDDLTGAHYGN